MPALTFSPLHLEMLAQARAHEAAVLAAQQQHQAAQTQLASTLQTSNAASLTLIQQLQAALSSANAFIAALNPPAPATPTPAPATPTPTK